MSVEDAARGTLLPPSGMLLYRQINPGKMKSDGPGKSNFLPENDLELSTRREAITAKGAHDAFIAEGGKSLGTWGLTVQEAHDTDLPSYDDENLEGCPPFHVTILFPEGITRGRRERIAQALHKHAKQRGTDGWLYGPMQD